ncbi:DUF433 domain-containing protein [Brevundimonas sp. NIBR11]|uniref:DUF433 domain-containing protein n=1 Tax=Brevundimonas sp. NIBR11 TaxID=3015999 RepID=UPI0022F12FEF|nr:DUF433 domain-containing protein [Brevundimonas sp. NIBR11]
MPRSIVCIPEKFGGGPHIEGTDRTIAEVQTFWGQPGVHADQLRQRFPELSEAEIGAAVAWVEPKDPTYLFVAEGLGPSPQRFTICGDTGDWAVLIENLDADGVVRSSQDY